MMVYRFLLLFKKITMRKDVAIKYTKKTQLEWLHKFDNPIDRIERSYYQYLLQKRIYGRFLFFISNIMSFFLLIFLRKKRFRSPTFLKHFDCVIRNQQNSSLDYDKIITGTYCFVDNYVNLYDEDVYNYYKILRKRYPLSFYFRYKCIIMIAQINSIIKSYTPNNIIATCEFSFTSSILTDFCESQKCSLINVMHGEKLFCVRDSFFSFSKCYVFNEAYINLFKELRAEDNQFVLFSLIKEFVLKPTKIVIYYLQIASKKDIKKILNILKKIQKNGYFVYIRPHPTYTKMKYLLRMSNKYGISVDNRSFSDSFKDAFYCISLFSTTLMQSYYSKKKTIIDDITNIKNFNRLKCLDYWLLKKDETILLSNFLKGICCDDEIK